jgi:sulfur carrier protein ThiS
LTASLQSGTISIERPFVYQDSTIGGAVPRVVYRDKEWRVPTNITVRDAIKKGDLNPETVLATRDGKLITEDVHLKAEDVIKLMAVISGGQVVIRR